MKLNKYLSVAAAIVITGGLTNLFAYDAEKAYEQECQGCHGPMHQGGVGSDIRPEKVKDKTTLRDIVKHMVLTHAQNNMNIELLEEKPLNQDQKDLQLLQK